MKESILGGTYLAVILIHRLFKPLKNLTHNSRNIKSMVRERN